MQNVSSENRLLTLFSLTKVRLIKAVGARIVAHSDDLTAVKVPINFLTKNHLNSMYFGALMIGAEVASGFHLVYQFRNAKHGKLSFAFKDVKASFLKRAESDVEFRAAHSHVQAFVDELKKTGERREVVIPVEAYCKENTGGFLKVAAFEFTLSAAFKPLALRNPS